MNDQVHSLVYRYPRNTGNAAYPRDVDKICRQLSAGLIWHRLTSILLIICLLGIAGYYVVPCIGIFFGVASILMVALKIYVLQSKAVHFNYTMDQNWKNFANIRMAPFTYMVKCERIWEVLSSQGGYDRKYHAGCSVQVSRKDVRVEKCLPFPFKANVNAYAIFLADCKVVFLPDCVYVVRGTDFKALHYEEIRWHIGTVQFVESSPPSDARVVGKTWQYVNKKGGPDRRFNYNPQLSECLYGEFEVNFARERRAKFLLSGTKMVEGIMKL